MQDFDLLNFLSHNYISLGTLVNQNMWRSYCYGDPNIWWWHLQEETEMPLGETTYHFTENNRYRVSLTLLITDQTTLLTTYYLYIEDLKLSKVYVYVSVVLREQTFSGFLLPDSVFKNLSIELLNSNGDLLHSYAWGSNTVILKGRQLLISTTGLEKAILIFDRNAALMYLYNSTNTFEAIVYFLSFSEQSDAIIGMEYSTSEVTNITNSTNPPSSRLATGLNNTHTYIYNTLSNTSFVRLYRNNNNTNFAVLTSDSGIVRPLDTNFSWAILFFFRPTPVQCSDPTDCTLLLPINQHFTGQHGPVTIWNTTYGIRLSIDCGDEKTYPFILLALIMSGDTKYFLEASDGFTSMNVSPDYNLRYPYENIALHNNDVLCTKYYDQTTVTQQLCGVQFSSLFHYHNNNAEPLIWLFHYDNSDDSRMAYIIYTENMADYAQFITNDYTIVNIYIISIYDQMIDTSEERYNISFYLDISAYYNHLNKFFIFNTLAHTAPQVVNGCWNYMHYLRFVLDDYTSSNLRIPIAIVEGDIKRGNIKYREVSVDKMPTSQRYPIVPLASLSKAHMPDVVLDGYIASLNADAGKKENSTFGTLVPYYDLKEATIQEPHPEWYFRIHIHAGTWYYIFKDITSSTQMKTYRIQHNDGGLRIVLDIGLYFEIITENTSNNNTKYTILYADIFPSVYWCYAKESYEFLNVNVEWIQCRYSMHGNSMVRARPNDDTAITGRPDISL